MSEQLPTPKNALTLRAALAGARADVLAALEKGKALPAAEIIELRGIIEEALQAYNDLLAAAAPAERNELEHTLGRQAIDLRRTAAMIPQIVSGTATTLSADKVPGGGQPFIETRAPGRSILGDQSHRRRDKGHQPGDEVEAWCGPCDGLRNHNIIAVVDGQPKQVICQSCKARHGFRLTPARTKAKDDGSPRPAQNIPYKARKTPEELHEEKRKQESAKLKQELDLAQGVVPFDPRRRYKGGQVIEHPEFGRGKIENILKFSMLVRFPVGLKSISLK